MVNQIKIKRWYNLVNLLMFRFADNELKFKFHPGPIMSA